MKREIIFMGSQSGKRLIWAICGGIALPLGYFFIAAFLAVVFKLYLPYILKLPIIWPGILYNYFFPDTDDFKVFSEFRSAVLLAYLYGNFLVYTILTYIFLWWKEKAERKIK